jgi:23S rRNA maturation mini-RNase III
MAVAAVDLVLEQELQELDVAQLPLARMGDAIGQRREQAALAQPFQSADEIRSSIISKASARTQAALIRSGP